MQKNKYFIASIVIKKAFELENDEYYFQAYNGAGNPVYMSKEAYEKMEHINCLDGQIGSYTVIISLELYNYLIKKYLRLECRPVFLGNVKDDDPEYKRLKALDTGNNTFVNIFRRNNGTL